jgi:hypothetical protein
MLPAGKYYIGDLCYVMHEEWDEVCELFFKGRTDHGCNQGEFMLKDGRRFACYNTRWGDGVYFDEARNRYPVDAGCIGCILVSDITPGDNNNVSSGTVHDMDRDFNSSTEDGVLTFGHVVINTDNDDGFNDYEEEEYAD